MCPSQEQKCSHHGWGGSAQLGRPCVCGARESTPQGGVAELWYAPQLCSIPGGTSGGVQLQPPHLRGSHRPADLCSHSPIGMSGPRPVVLSGPSGAGKSTLLKRLLQEHGSIFGFSVSREVLGIWEALVTPHPGAPHPYIHRDMPILLTPPPHHRLSWVLQEGPGDGVCGLWIAQMGPSGLWMGHRSLFLDTTRDPRPGEENGKGELAPHWPSSASLELSPTPQWSG